MVYRPDLDGMRAIAVVAVVLFHLQLEHFAGGFVGVDVFFVLSGFLITGIITTRIGSGSFSFADFYLRRIRRLVPPLLATVVATSVVAAVVLYPEDTVAFGRSAVAALFSLSNLVFFAESGYWDTEADLKPLLHTWSLGVEEQFYLVWPALVVGLHWRRLRAPFALTVVLVATASLTGALWMHSADPSAAFYLFPFRIFQFSFGALVGCAMGRIVRLPGSVRTGLLVAGLGLVVVSVLTYDGAVEYPGWRALAPTIGTAAVLAAGGSVGTGRAWVRWLLENPVAVWLGVVSYSMYLVHWPVIALYRYQTGLELSATEQAGLAGVIVAATVGLHHGVERRFYTRTGAGDRSSSRPRLAPGRFALRTFGASAVAAVVLSSMWLADGWTWRFDELRLTPDQIEAGMRHRFDRVRVACRLRDLDGDRCHLDRDVQVLLIGNSHEPDGYNFLAAGYGDDPGVNLVSFGTTNRCDDLTRRDDRWSSSSEDCRVRLDNLFDREFLRSLDYVAYVAYRPFDGENAQLLDLVASVKAASGARLITFGGYIVTNAPCSRLVNRHGTTRACASPDHVTYFGDGQTVESLQPAFEAVTDVFVDRVGLLCDGRVLVRCETEVEGVPMMYDKHHLSLEFSEHAGRLYAARHPGLLAAPDG